VRAGQFGQTEREHAVDEEPRGEQPKEQFARRPFDAGVRRDRQQHEEHEKAEGEQVAEHLVQRDAAPGRSPRDRVHRGQQRRRVQIPFDAVFVSSAHDGDDVVSLIAERDELVGDVGVPFVDERLRAAGGESPELLHHRAHDVGVGHPVDVDLLEVVLGGCEPLQREDDRPAEQKPERERDEERIDDPDEKSGAERVRDDERTTDRPSEYREDERDAKSDPQTDLAGIAQSDGEAPGEFEFLDKREPRPESLNRDLDVPIDQRDVEIERLRLVDRGFHVRPRLDVEPVAQARLDVREHPVREELIDRVPLQQIARVQVLRGFTADLAIPPLVEFDSDDVRALLVDDRFDLLDAGLRNVGCPDDPNRPRFGVPTHCRHESGEGFTCIGTD
jgi:hypothetical protein